MTNPQTEARAIARRLWAERGGGQHGPHTETLTMPLDNFGGFVDALIATALSERDATIAAKDAELVEREKLQQAKDEQYWHVVEHCANLEADLKRAESSLAEREAEMGREWQPIETAPKDGTQVLLHRSGEDSLYTTRWVQSEVMGPVWCTPDGHVILRATHWMPLPAAPATRTGGQE